MRLLKHVITNLIVVMLMFISPSFAYDLATHNKITEEAYYTSGLSTYLKNLGISADDKFDVSNISNTDIGIVNDGTPRGWLQEGSVREDDISPSDTGGKLRFQNHFFDPVYDRGLDIYALGLHVTGYRAPDWALEDNATYAEQLYSINHAKQYFLAGLTAIYKTEREENLAKAFRSLGQVMHTIEDMAQPQHTRNDSHGGEYLGGFINLGEKSAYESYVNENVASFNYTPGYIPSSPTFKSYRNFYTTGDGKGMAEFSNRSFVTAGTNFNCTNLDLSNPFSTCLNAYYSNPVLSVYLKEEVQIADLLTELGMSNSNNLSGIVTFFGNSITDTYSGETFENSRMTTHSIFDKDLINKGSAPTFTLNNANYKAMAKYLLPRAVGYSAGLLNYFFRGQINMEKDPDNPGQYIIKNESSERMEGAFTLYYDDINDNRREVANWSLSINANDKSGPVSFTAPTTPEPKEYGEYMLVFNGKLGNEEGAVVGREITDPTSFGRVVSVSNYYGGRGNITVYTKGGVIRGKLPSTGLYDVRAVRFDMDDWNTFVVLAAYAYDCNLSCKARYEFHKYTIDELTLSLNYQGVVLQEGPIFTNELSEEIIYEMPYQDDYGTNFHRIWYVQENIHSLDYVDFFLKGGNIKPFGIVHEDSFSYLYVRYFETDGGHRSGFIHHRETSKLYYDGVVQEKTPYNCQGGYYTESGEVVACQPQEPQDTYFVPLAIFNSSDYAYALYQYQFTEYFAGQPQYGSYLTNVVSTLPIIMPQYLQINQSLKTMLREDGKYSFYTKNFSGIYDGDYHSYSGPIKSYSSEIGVADCSGLLITDTQVGDGYLGWQSSGKIVSFENCSDWQPLGRTGSGGDKFDVILNYQP